MVKRLSFPFLGFLVLSFSVATWQPVDASSPNACNGKDCKWFESESEWIPGAYLCISVPRVILRGTA